jgi:DNA gyrase subunit A
MKPDPKDLDITHTVDPSLTLLTICENGYGKRTAVDEYRVQPETGPMRSQSRGGKGRADIKTTDRNGRAIAAVGVREGDDVVVVSKGGQLVRMAAASISQYGRGTQGVRIVSLHEGDQVATVASVPSESNGAEPTSTGPAGG